MQRNMVDFIQQALYFNKSLIIASLHFILGAEKLQS